MKIIVTGGAGFIGSHLVGELIKKGESVVVIDDFNDFYDPGLKRDNVAMYDREPRFKLREMDIRDRAGVEAIFREESPDAVCHLAARAGVRPSINDPFLYEEVNCLGTLNLLDAARAVNVRNFVFASSSSVYGINSKVPFSEEDPITCPISPYASTKRAGELMSYTYSHLYGLNVTCLRFFTVYGERGRPDMAVAKFTKAVREGREIEVYGDGSARRDFTYVGDILDGVMRSIYTPSRYEIVNIGGANMIDVNGLISLIEKNLGKKAVVKYSETAPGDVPITYADVTKAKRLLGFAPKVRIDEGVARYVRWFLEREGAISA
ncbi:MAG: epimerase [Deltaproteobacteria bacterium GWC2_56_8]|nr:MAG: epimerase [Deltaproteobacteria bacterium GWB2_55_19]OGP38997.1 MAG: epimerase [Deltaproteobacteria bacterium GWC2_56_8]HAO93592.1 epimerase [Deltaproteobacteria bacterium]